MARCSLPGPSRLPSKKKQSIILGCNISHFCLGRIRVPYFHFLPKSIGMEAAASPAGQQGVLGGFWATRGLGKTSGSTREGREVPSGWREKPRLGLAFKTCWDPLRQPLDNYKVLGASTRGDPVVCWYFARCFPTLCWSFIWEPTAAIRLGDCRFLATLWKRHPSHFLLREVRWSLLGAFLQGYIFRTSFTMHSDHESLAKVANLSYSFGIGSQLDCSFCGEPLQKGCLTK